MSVHKPVTNPGIYFITFTCHQWLPLIQLTNGYDMVYNWFTVLKAKGHITNAFVIMPNHLHILLYYSGGQSLNAVVGNGKRFMAYDMINRLTKADETVLLDKLSRSVTAKDRSRGKKHEVWEGTFDAKECRTEKFVMQKLNYIHNNPCSGKWKLADSSIHYPHSSASFYITGKHRGYEVTDYREFLKFVEFE